MIAKPFYQNILHICLVIILGFGFWHLLNPNFQYQAQGIFLPSSKNLPNFHSNPEHILVLQNIPQKASAKKLGTIRTTIHFSEISPQADQENAKKIVEKARALAALYGADAIVINYVGRQTKVDQLDAMSLEANAISLAHHQTVN